MRKINVLHIASFNGNIGDNANHNGLRNKIAEYLGVNFHYDELEMREFYRSWNIRDFNSNGFIELANKYDFLIIGGGNFFELKWDYSYTGTTVNLSENTLSRINPPIFFFGLGCDIAKGASKEAINKFDKFLENITNSEKYIVSVRNDGSYDVINKLYGNKYNGKVHKVADGAFFLKTKTYDFPEINNKLKAIGINIVADMKDIRFNKDLSYEEFINNTAEVVNNFLKQNPNYQVILFPHIYSDLEAISELLAKIKDIYRRTRIVVAPCLTGNRTEEYIFGLYRKCDIILGMRFHSNVCAIAQNIPTIALASYKKINDLYSELNLTEQLININEKGFNKNLFNKINDTMENIDEIKHKYKKVNRKLEEEASLFYNKLKKWAEQNNILN